jgi:hypothetical protein
MGGVVVEASAITADRGAVGRGDRRRWSPTNSNIG